MSFFREPESKGSDKMKDEKVEQLKSFNEPAKEISVAALKAISEFTAELEATKTYSDLANQSVDKNCRANFATLSVTLEDKENWLEDPTIAPGLLEDLPRMFAELNRDLTKYKESDKNPQRQQKYTAALELIEKIDHVYSGTAAKPAAPGNN
jgi:hypothetical protein